MNDRRLFLATAAAVAALFVAGVLPVAAPPEVAAAAQNGAPPADRRPRGTPRRTIATALIGRSISASTRHSTGPSRFVSRAVTRPGDRPVPLKAALLLPDQRLLPLLSDNGRLNPEIVAMGDRAREERRTSSRGPRKRF